MSPVSPGPRWIPRCALLVPIALFTLRSEHWITGSIFAAIAIGSGFGGRGWSLSRVGQLLLALAAVALVYPVQLALIPPESAGPFPLGRFGTVVVLAAIFISLPRRYLANPRQGERGNAALNLVAMVGCSQGNADWLYPTFIALFALLQLWALRAMDPGRPPLGALTARHRLATALMMLIICTAGAGLALSLPPAQQWAMRTFFFSFLKGRTGFSDQMNLGSLDSMYRSDEMVLRVFGPKPDHLRGVVYNRYRSGRWLEDRDASTRLAKLPASRTTEGGPPRTRIMTVGGDPRRYFIPLRARAIGTDLGLAQVSNMGVLTTPTGEEAAEASFLPGTRDRYLPPPPDADDLEVPDKIAPRLREIGQRWVAPGATPAQRLVTIESRLQREFSYSLSFKRRPDRDPLIDFLTRSRQGHCEYFASAMALLARAVGVPARVVSGYRVRERNPLGGHHVVRERNAHSWVEGWVEGQGWQTYDPTPPAALSLDNRGEMSTMAALVDLAAAKIRAAWSWLTGLTLFHMGGAAASLFIMWGIVRLRLWRRRGIRKLIRAKPLAYRDPLPSITLLLGAMASRGFARQPAEPLESYAHRLAMEPDLGEQETRAISLLRRYAAWRYGGEGDAATLAAELEEAAL